MTDEPEFRQSYAPCLKHCKSCVGDDACRRPADERKNDCSFVGSRAVGGHLRPKSRDFQSRLASETRLRAQSPLAAVDGWQHEFLGSACGTTLQSAAQTARKQRPVPSVASRHLPAPRGVTLKGTPKYTADYQPKFVMAFTTKLSETVKTVPYRAFYSGQPTIKQPVGRVHLTPPELCLVASENWRKKQEKKKACAPSLKDVSTCLFLFL